MGKEKDQKPNEKNYLLVAPERTAIFGGMLMEYFEEEYKAVRRVNELIEAGETNLKLFKRMDLEINVDTRISIKEGADYEFSRKTKTGGY